MFENYTLKLVKSGRALFSSDKSGLRPLAECINKMKGRVHGCALYDKVIGLAAAKLIVYGGFVSEVKAQVMSGKAKEYLENQGIKASAEQIVSRILNKSRTGQCPMEERCTDLEPEECYNAAKCRYILSQQSL